MKSFYHACKDRILYKEEEINIYIISHFCHIFCLFVKHNVAAWNICIWDLVKNIGLLLFYYSM